MTTDLSKQEYLKRYLEDGKGSDKKKRKKLRCSNSHVSRIKILDQNIDLKSIKFGEKDLDEDEDEPVIAEIIDDRPLEIKVKEMYDASRWKKVGSDADERKTENDSTISERNLKYQDDHPPLNDILSTTKKSLKNKRRHDSDSDISPSRNKCINSHKRNSDSDISPPRSYQKNVNEKSKISKKISSHNHSMQNSYVQNTSFKLSKEEKSLNRARHDSDSDLSPARKDTRSKKDSGSDVSPLRNHISSNKNNHLDHLQVSKGKRFLQNKSRHDSGSDVSPPRRNQQSISGTKNSDSDISPPRNYQKSLKRGSKNSDSDISPPRVKKDAFYKHRHDSRSDESDVEKKIVHLKSKHSKKASSRKSKDSEKSTSHRISESIQKKEGRQASESTSSPSRAKLSRNTEKSYSNDGRNKPDKTLLGLKAGLQSASTLRIETQELREREKKHINKLHENLSGRNAETIVRDRQTGMKRDLQAERLEKDAEEKKKNEHQKKYMEWGKGVEQTENRQKRLEDDLYEMSKPLARYCDDEDLEERLKSVIHEEDPMAEYMRKKKRKNEPAVPIYSGPPPPPNRFGIRPGYRWDGVDRSNGFEKRYFEKNNASKATQEEAYLWSVQDM